MARFHLQGHRGSRGTSPENTLPSFEQALDARVSSIETDIHLTRDGIPVLCHDPFLSPAIFRRSGGSGAALVSPILIRHMSLPDLREWAASGNPAPERFPDQRADVTSLARICATEHKIDPFSVPTLSDFHAFVSAYAGEPGMLAGKTPEQRRHAGKLIFDFEIKFIPFHADRYAQPEAIIERVLAAIHDAAMEYRTVIRSFDHRLLKRVAEGSPRVSTALLIAAAAPTNPVQMVREAGASIYCPLFEYVDADLIRSCHQDGVRVLPWTVNQVEDWDRLLDWGVDGITTDFPDQLRQHLESRQIDWE
jgi:glycerophosphoryl diester phosphodiesterase